jgi:hypothetical protein
MGVALEKNGTRPRFFRVRLVQRANDSLNALAEGEASKVLEMMAEFVITRGLRM